jgi:hypothetical protein
MGKMFILKPLLRSLNTIYILLIIFTFQLIQTIWILWFCHRSERDAPSSHSGLLLLAVAVGCCYGWGRCCYCWDCWWRLGGDITSFCWTGAMMLRSGWCTDVALGLQKMFEHITFGFTLFFSAVGGLQQKVTHPRRQMTCIMRLYLQSHDI